VFLSCCIFRRGPHYPREPPVFFLLRSFAQHQEHDMPEGTEGRDRLGAWTLLRSNQESCENPSMFTDVPVC
jgi:hypothetical protein